MKVRVDKTKDYTVMCNYHLREKDMSLKAKGLLTLIFSLPDNWDYTIEGLSKITKDGVDSIRSAIHELEQFGYIERERVRNSNGKFGGIEYIIHEKPIEVLEENEPNPNMDNWQNSETETEASETEEPDASFSTADKPILENPMQVNTMQENQGQLNTNILNTNILNTNISNHSARRYYPDERLDKLFREFIYYRKRINKPLTNDSLPKIKQRLLELSKNSDGTMDVDKAIRIVQTALRKGWNDFYPLKEDDNQQNGSSSSLGREYSESQMDELEKKLLSN